LVGDTYVVNGSKIWTTHAHHANRMIALLRTSDTGRRQEGITAFGIDLTSPGVEIRPIISIDGEHEVNEVFFSDLRVPVGARIGGEGQGWKIAKYLLEFERGTGLFAGRLRSSLRRIERVARELGRLDDPEIAGDLGELTAEIDCFEMMEFMTLSPVEPGQSPGPVASVLKLRASRLKQATSQLGVKILGEEALRFDADVGQMTGTLVAEALSARAATIFGGAAEIQLSIIAKSLARL
jgi:acyl-CoA dehydrogenase